jgi:hypothetical protein
MKLNRSKNCPLCRGTAIMQGPIEYPDLEVRQCCPACSDGQLLAAEIAEIIARAQANKRARVA